MGMTKREQEGHMGNRKYFLKSLLQLEKKWGKIGL